MNPRVVTIGVYGYSEESFFQALNEAGVDTLLDLRQRRGVRGRDYAFANSQRMQRRLLELGIAYIHRKDLAPTPGVRQRQNEADIAGKVAKRQRAELSQAFVDAYHREILDGFQSQSLLDDLGPEPQVVALLCVEREPAACHRSLVASKLREELGLAVEHLLPPQG